MKKQKRNSKMKQWLALTGCCLIGVLHPGAIESVEASMLGGPSHIGTFEGSTTFTTTSSNGINPGLYLEVLDEYGNYTEYTSEDGVITVPNTREGAYVTQAKLLGKTKYRDQDTGELLDQWEAGRNLTLESVEGPELTTVGKNLFDSNTKITTGYGINTDNGEPYKQSTHSYTGFLRIKPSTTYTVRQNHSDSWAFAYDKNKKYIGLIKSNIKNNANFTTPGNAYYVRLDFLSTDTLEIIDGFCIEEGSTSTGYEPYQSNLLTVKEDVELRGVGKVRDELDCLTGELIENIFDLDCSNTDFEISDISISSTNTIRFMINNANIKSVADSSKNNMSNKLAYKVMWSGDEEGYYVTNSNRIVVRLNKDKITSTVTREVIKDYLIENNFKFIVEKTEKSIKTVALNSTYYFQPVLNRSVEVNGTVLPLVYSVTVPTDPLSFILNPNAEEGQRFIAPTFTITNDTPASIQIELKAFEQTTNTFRDVLPTKYPDWNQLSKDQSKDFALALLPVPSEGWASLKEGPRYVADSSNYNLGEIKAESSVDFTFTASHGRAFVERLNPQYRLSFIFGF